MKIRSLLCALCVLCGGLSAHAAPLVSLMATTNAVHVVKVPAYRIDWPTQTNTFHRATVTNLYAATSTTTGNAVIGGTLGVTGNVNLAGSLGVTGTITGPGSGITGVLAANVPIVDAGGLLTATNTETALAELATELAAVDVSAYVAKSGSTMTGALELNYSQPELLVTSSDALHASLILSRTYDISYPNIYSKLLTLEGSSGDILSEIRTTQINATQSQLTFDVHGSPGTEVVKIGPTNILFNANLTAADISSPAGTITAGLGFSGPGSALTSLTAGNLVGDIPTASFGEVAIRWSDRDFHLEEGTTNSVGWVSYTNTSGSRRYTIDALCSAITTDQAATLRSTVVRVPRGFTAFKTTGALRVTWVSNDSGGDNEVRAITLTGWSDITSTETVLFTDTSTVHDVTAAGTPTVISIDRSAFSSTTVPQWIAVDVKLSVEDGDKSGVLLVEVLSE